jgi:hypothetical protein
MADDLASRYAPMIAKIADLHSANPVVFAQMKSLVVNKEEWDKDRRGGHFWFDVSANLSDPSSTVDAWGEDEDGAPIEIILHLVDGRLAWGEWFRWDGDPILSWPTTAVHPRIQTQPKTSWFHI